jgi:hypothetical protein
MWLKSTNFHILSFLTSRIPTILLILYTLSKNREKPWEIRHPTILINESNNEAAGKRLLLWPRLDNNKLKRYHHNVLPL